MKQYESYKDSGIEWLGMIPSHWELCKVKNHYNIITGFTPSTSNQSYYTEDSKYTWVTIADLKQRTVFDSTNHISELYVKEYKPQIVAKGSLMYSFKLSVGAVAFAGKDLYTNEAIASFEDNDNVDLNFLYYSSQYYIIKNANINIYGAHILNQDLIRNAYIVFPPLEEQRIISSYLDNKVSQIDSVILEKGKMVEDLQSYRKSIISELVTSGLNPDIPKKDSGNQWIGIIPSHWSVCKIKHVIELLTDYDANGSFADIAKNCNINNGNPYAWMVRATDLENHRYGIVEGNNYCDLDTYNYLSKSSLKPDDILIAKRGEIGKSYIVPQCDVPMTLAPNTYLLITRQEIINNWYLFFYLQSVGGIENLKALNKSTTLGALYKDDVKAMSIPLPSMEEQCSIVEKIKNIISNVDTMIADVKNEIEELKAYKVSLISEAVTGKIDLR